VRELYNLLWGGVYQYTVFTFADNLLDKALDFVEKMRDEGFIVQPEDVKFEKVRYEK